MLLTYNYILINLIRFSEYRNLVQTSTTFHDIAGVEDTLEVQVRYIIRGVGVSSYSLRNFRLRGTVMLAEAVNPNAHYPSGDIQIPTIPQEIFKYLLSLRRYPHTHYPSVDFQIPTIPQEISKYPLYLRRYLNTHYPSGDIQIPIIPQEISKYPLSISRYLNTHYPSGDIQISTIPQ